MRTEIMLDRIVTQTYITILQKCAREYYPEFHPENGTISYDLENECYLFENYNKEELAILHQLNRMIRMNQAA